MRSILPAVLAFVPQAAWAHGDHGGVTGLHHVLTEPAHLAVLLLAGAALWLLGRGEPVTPKRVRERAGNDRA